MKYPYKFKSNPPKIAGFGLVWVWLSFKSLAQRYCNKSEEESESISTISVNSKFRVYQKTLPILGQIS